MNQTRKVWHTEVITPQVEQVIDKLSGQNLARDFYLGGGTGLALHVGHRKSADLDFFSPARFDEETLVSQLSAVEKISLISRDRQTLHIHLAGVKVSFLGYPYPVLFPLESFREIQVADVRDIASMKISAIASRGTRRDFIDLYVVCRSYGLDLLLDLFGRKFAQVEYNRIHVLKSLAYFEDAEKEPMPDMLSDISWQQVRNFLSREVKRLIPQ